MPFPQSFLDELIARNDIVDVVGSYVSPDAQGRQLLGLLPLPQRKDTLLPCAAGQAVLPLLRLQKGRRRHQLRHGASRICPIPTRCGFWPSGPTCRCRRRPATATEKLRAPDAGAEPGRRPVVLSDRSRPRRARPSGTIWTGGRSTGGSPCASAWAPRRTAGTPC